MPKKLILVACKLDQAFHVEHCMGGSGDGERVSESIKGASDSELN